MCSLWGVKSDKHYNFNGSANIITFFNKSEVILKDLFAYPSDRNFDSLGSTEYTAAFCDEANQITEKAKNILSSRLRYKLDKFNIVPKLLLTCNPSKNWVYTEFYRPSKSNTLPPYRKFIQSLIDDNKYISKHYKGQLEKLDRLSKERLLYGNLEYDASDDNLIEYNSILNLFSQIGVEGEKYITCDVARFGNDKSVVMLWSGKQVTHIKTFDTNTITELADYIKNLQQKESVNLNNIIADSDGVGGGLTDILRCRDFVNNSRPLRKENYQNLKTQCYYKLADEINKGQIGINTDNITVRQRIIEECEQIRSKDLDKDSKLKIVDKDTIKTILGRSPDYADCLAMRMFYEIDSNYGKYYIH